MQSAQVGSMRLTVFYNVVKFQTPNCNTFRDMIYCPVWILVQSGQTTDRQTDRRTESDAYEPTVQNAQVGSKNEFGMGFKFTVHIQVKVNVYSAIWICDLTSFEFWILNFNRVRNLDLWYLDPTPTPMHSGRHECIINIQAPFIKVLNFSQTL